MDKENVKEKFFEMIKNSWTYQKLTFKERENYIDLLYSAQVENCLKGTYKQRWNILQAIYHAFLMGLDYKPIGWREELDDIPLF